MIKNGKSDYFRNVSEKIKSEHYGTKNWWNLIKNLMGTSGRDRSIPPLQLHDTVISSDIDKCEIFNNYFCEQSNLDDSGVNLPVLTAVTHEKLEVVRISETEVEDIFKTLDCSKATGPDLVKPRLLKEAASVLKTPFCRLFNYSLTTSTFPTPWKYANVTPVVFKK